MLVRMKGLVKRGGVWLYRREVPKRLRSIIGSREVKRTLGTGDLNAAQRKWQKVNAEVDRLFTEAEAAAQNPSIAAYKAVEDWRKNQAVRPDDDGQEDALDLHLTTLLERDDLDRTKRIAVEALLRRRDYDGADNPPLSILFERYYSERKLPPKTKLEWDGVLKRFTTAVGADLPVRAITAAHIRTFKTALYATTGRTGKALAGATVKKALGALGSVLSWAKREGYLPANPAEGITTAVARGDSEDRRLPYDADDLKTLFSESAVNARRKHRPADYWLPILALYTGARLEELGQLRTSDVRREDGVDFLAIEGGDGKRLKTRSSRRRIPIHPQLVQAGFLVFVDKQRAAGYERLFPELRATRLGSLTAAWSKYWGRHARDLGVTDKRKTFHSFRHGFKDAARAAGMPEEHHDAITGHANGSVGRGYGLGVPLRVLAESMAKVTYPGLRGSAAPRT
jgi:integrase